MSIYNIFEEVFLTICVTFTAIMFVYYSFVLLFSKYHFSLSLSDFRLFREYLDTGLSPDQVKTMQRCIDLFRMRCDELEDSVDSLCMQCHELEDSLEWREFEIEMPIVDGDYYVIVKGATSPTTLFYDATLCNWYDEMYESYIVSHWMPMPELPKVKGE